MKAITIEKGDSSNANLILSDVPIPNMQKGQALIKTLYAGVNRPDILQRRGLYSPPSDASPYLGLEVSGVISEIEDNPKWKIGDEICALVHGGGYAEYVNVDIGSLMPIPKGLTLLEAAALPENFLTVYSNLVEIGQLQKSDTILVHGANSGIGSVAIMIAKAFGNKVIASARGALKCEFAKSLGADFVIDITTQDFVEKVKELGGADIVLDILGGDYTSKNILVLKNFGRLVQVGLTRGAKAEIDLMKIMQKQAIITGSLLRPRPAIEKARLTKAVLENIWHFIEAGKITPKICKVFKLADANLAHQFLENGEQFGKIVLEV